MTELPQSPSAEDGRRAFRAAGITINADQADALAALLWQGKIAGTNHADIEPVRVAALLPIGKREGLDQPDLARDRPTREYIPDPENPELVLMTPPMPPSNTLLAVAEDGRMWQIVRAGIVWQVDAEGPA